MNWLSGSLLFIALWLIICAVIYWGLAHDRKRKDIDNERDWNNRS